MTPKQIEAARRAVGGLTDDELDQAVVEYGDWHLPTLKAEYQQLKSELERATPEGGIAWAWVRKMAAAIAMRETHE